MGHCGVLSKVDDLINEARDIIQEGRLDDYGHPFENHTATAALWKIYLSRRCKTSIDLDIRDVCMLNILQKIARDSHRSKHDNLVDIIGWILNIYLAEEKIIGKTKKKEES